MSVEDRLYALVSQFRQQWGDAALRSPGLVDRLGAQAPDLQGEIRALARAIELDAGQRVANAADGAAERHDIAARIAASERLSMSSVKPAVVVAARLGTLDPVAAAPAGDTWAGDSVAVGVAGRSPASAPGSTTDWASAAAAPTAATPSTAAAGGPPAGEAGTSASQPLWKNKWVMIAAAVAAVVLLSRPSPEPQPQPQQPQGQPQGQPMPGQPMPGPQGQPMAGPQGQPMPPQWPPMAGPQGQPMSPQGQPMANPQMPPMPQVPQAPLDPLQNPPPGAPQMGPDGPPLGMGVAGMPPMLVPPSVGTLPPIPMERLLDGSYMLSFQLKGRAGPVTATMLLPSGGWDAGQAVFAFNAMDGVYQLGSMGMGMFTLLSSPQGPVRATRPYWHNDKVPIGNICVAFQGQGNQDVILRGSTMCVLDAECRIPAGCGRVP